MQTSYFGYTLQLRPKDIDSNDEEEDAGQKVGYITLSTMPLDELDESMGFQLEMHEGMEFGDTEALFDDAGELSPEYARLGNVCWGPEVNTGSITYIEELILDEGARGKGLGTWVLNALWGRVDCGDVTKQHVEFIFARPEINEPLQTLPPRPTVQSTAEERIAYKHDILGRHDKVLNCFRKVRSLFIPIPFPLPARSLPATSETCGHRERHRAGAEIEGSLFRFLRAEEMANI